MSEHVTERCPKCGETERHYWCRCRTLIKGTVCPMCDRTREEAMERGHAGDPIPLACGTEITPDGRVILEGEACLRRQLAQAKEQLQQALAREAELRRVAEKLQHIWVWFYPTRRPNEPDEAYQRRYDKFHELAEALDAALSSAEANPYAAAGPWRIPGANVFRRNERPEMISGEGREEDGM